ncbi:MAG: GNAT family N-acetyltransferase [Rhodospirillales bacterium]|nr:GNAT family N-acetyltransferase [Rhodospirillales bacterium]
MVTIRSATPGDADAIANVYVNTWRSVYADLLLEKMLVGMSHERTALYWRRVIAEKPGRDLVRVADTDDRLVIGFASAGASRHRGLGFGGEIYTLYVLDEFQGAGTGQALLFSIFRRLLDRGLRSSLVWVLAGNPSRFFYEVMGGGRVAEREETMWGVRLNEIAFGWRDLDATLKGPRAASAS